MSYRLNDIELSSYGILPGQAPGSNVALSGFLDLPKRAGKAYHSWPDEEGAAHITEPDA